MEESAVGQHRCRWWAVSGRHPRKRQWAVPGRVRGRQSAVTDFWRDDGELQGQEEGRYEARRVGMPVVLRAVRGSVGAWTRDLTHGYTGLNRSRWSSAQRNDVATPSGPSIDNWVV